MIEDTDEEHLEKPTNTQSEDLSDQVISTNELDLETSKQKPENMEVHQHAHQHGKKTWKDYLWEFLMLFLAVFCGFFAEYQLEHVIEHSREKEYIQSMIEDARTDTMNFQNAIQRNKNRVLGLDTLVTGCFEFEKSDSSVRELYRLNRRYNYHPDVATLTERTISQLKNAGGMRLIRNRASTDIITYYVQTGKNLDDQEEWYQYQLREVSSFSHQIFSMKYYQHDPVTAKQKRPLKSFASMSLLANDKTVIIQFGNQVEMLKAIILYYITRLEEANQQAVKLIETLTKEYHLK